MGFGDFGSNGSVHWRIQHTGGPGGGADKDPILFDQIGGGGGHAGKFRVRLKFRDEATARAALANAQINPQGMVVVDVPKIEPQQPSPVQKEVRVEW